MSGRLYDVNGHVLQNCHKVMISLTGVYSPLLNIGRFLEKRLRDTGLDSLVQYVFLSFTSLYSNVVLRR